VETTILLFHDINRKKYLSPDKLTANNFLARKNIGTNSAMNAFPQHPLESSHQLEQNVPLKIRRKAIPFNI
jgi:hypothetical protein